MAGPLPSEPSGPEASSRQGKSLDFAACATSKCIPERAPVTMDTPKKKKKSRKSKHRDRSLQSTQENGVEPATPPDEDTSRPFKRKRESEHEHKKKKMRKKKRHHEIDDDLISAVVLAVEDEQDQTVDSQQKPPEPHESSNPQPNGVNSTPVAAPTPQTDEVGYETTAELNSKGKPRKRRGARIGGKNNKRIGFFAPDEIELLEKFKLDFCNNNQLTGDEFDEMVQHSERDRTIPFPCAPEICTKQEFWAGIYGVIPDRDRRSVYRFMRRHFQVTTQKPHDWTDEQDEELISLFEEHGPKYTYIAKLLGRSDDDVTQRWKNKLEHRGTMNRGPWHEEELHAFLQAIQMVWEGYKEILHEGAGKDMYEMDEKLVGWGGISNAMQNLRSRQQCADKWRKVRKAVMTKRAAGFPDAVFDYTKTPTTYLRHAEREKSAKSKEYVDEDDDDGNVGDDDLPPSTSATPAPKYGFADEQMMMELARETEPEPLGQDLSSLQENLETRVESEPDVNNESIELETPAPTNDMDSPAPPTTPLSANDGQKRDAGRMARIKEKTKAANKASSSKKRKRAEVEQSTEPASGLEPESLREPSPSTDQQLKRERKRAKKEKKRRKRERKEREEREELARIQAEAEAEAAWTAAEQAAEGKEKAKKHKKNKRARDSTELVEAILAASPKKEKKKHRKSDTEPNGTVTEELASVEASSKEHNAEKPNQIEQEGNSEEPRIQESPTPTSAVEQSRASSLGGFSDEDSQSIKSEDTDSD